MARRHGPLALVHFDGHPGTWDGYFDNHRYTAGKPNRTAANKALADMIADGTCAKLTSELVGHSPAPSEPIRSLK